jgi:hypothetical protein
VAVHGVEVDDVLFELPVGVAGGAAGEDVDAIDGVVGEEERQELAADETRGAEKECTHEPNSLGDLARRTFDLNGTTFVVKFTTFSSP